MYPKSKTFLYAYLLWTSDQAASSESSNGVQRPQSLLEEQDKSEPSTEQKAVKPGTDKVLSSNKPKAAVPINLDSDAESYEVSGGAEASDEDDFDFYDKFWFLNCKQSNRKHWTN